MKFHRLLAKSWRKEWGSPPDSIYLPSHLKDVYRATVQIVEQTGSYQLSGLGLSPPVWGERFRRIVLLAAALHDLGKANDHFQEMVRNLRQVPQGLRHEWVTQLILHGRLHQWIAPALAVPEVDWSILQWSITGHHPKHGRESPPKGPAPNGAGSELKVLSDTPDFRACLTWIRDEFGLEALPEFEAYSIPLVGRDRAFNTLCKLDVEGACLFDSLDDEHRRFVAAVKNCLISVDVAGSSLPRNVLGEEDRAGWIPGSFKRVPSASDLRNIVADRLKCPGEKVPARLRPFQREVAEKAMRVTLVRAGCGTGKTLAAYYWAERHALCKDGTRRRLYICYPTTGTATEGFRDYLCDVSEVAREKGLERKAKAGARLFHGRRDIDLDMLCVAADEDGTDAPARIDSLEAWSTPIVSCTVDTVLGIVQNNRKGLYAWPALAQAAFVFDEIHAYDDALFGAMLRFLDAMRGVPILLMTASLPEGRRRELRRVLSRIGEELAEIPGPKPLEDLPRYYRQYPRDPHNPLTEVRAAVERGEKVLWVCNTVDRALQAARESADLGPLVYHSRFKYIDRVIQHRRVIDAFDPTMNTGAALAICTQVAEMSLDLSAALLVTDLAPIPALIQRLGRLNRRAMPPGPGLPLPETKPFIIVEPVREDGSPEHLPYKREDLEQAQEWLARLGDRRLAQSDLSAAWLAIDDNREPTHVPSAWLDGGPRTCVRELREGAPGMTVVMKQDLADLESGQTCLVEVALPMPLPPSRLNWRGWDMFRGVPVAPAGAIDYDPQRGARWAR